MRRWLALLLMVMLPLQFVWAAAAPYCGHERSGPATHHVGHHEHQHHDDASQASKHGTSADKLLGDNDCGTCHFSAGKALQADGLALPAAAGSAIVAAVVPAPLSRSPDPIERPNWRRA